MKALLDTNIIIHREASKVFNQDIGVLFKWLDKLKYTKCIHALTLSELSKHSDKSTVDSIKIKVQNYHCLSVEAPLAKEVEKISRNEDKTPNDIEDTKLLNELYCNRVDILISEDKKFIIKQEGSISVIEYFGLSLF